MDHLIDKIKDKLEEYDISIYEHYPIDEDEDILFVEDMMLVIKENTNELGVSFQVTTKPELVASNILILKEISGLEDVSVMESFIFTNDKKIICGEEAFDIVQAHEKEKTLKKAELEKKYQMILMNTDGYKC